MPVRLSPLVGCADPVHACLVDGGVLHDRPWVVSAHDASRLLLVLHIMNQHTARHNAVRLHQLAASPGQGVVMVSDADRGEAAAPFGVMELDLETKLCNLTCAHGQALKH